MDPFKFIKDNTYGINTSNIPAEKKVDKLLIFFSSVCAATAVQPIPFADIFILTPIQLYMGTLIAEARGYKFSMSEIYKEILGLLGLSFLAQQTAIGLYKLGLPFIGGFMTIPLVFILTYSIGKVMDFYFVSKTQGKTLTKDDLKNFFKQARKDARREKRAEKIADSLEKTIVLNGDGLDLDLLEEANIDKVDAVLALTDDDKTNMLSCTRAKESGCPVTISLVNDPSLTSLLSPMGVDGFISPRTTTVSSILQHIRHGLVKSVYSIGNAEAEVIEAQVLGTSSMSGHLVRDIKWPKDSILGAIKINGKTSIPKGDTKLQEGAIITIFALSKDISEIESMLQVGMDFF